MLVTLGGQRVNMFSCVSTVEKDNAQAGCYVICTVNLYRLSLLVSLTNYVQVCARKEKM